jgi:hypothetical protein
MSPIFSENARNIVGQVNSSDNLAVSCLSRLSIGKTTNLSTPANGKRPISFSLLSESVPGVEIKAERSESVVSGRFPFKKWTIGTFSRQDDKNRNTDDLSGQGSDASKGEKHSYDENNIVLHDATV